MLRIRPGCPLGVRGLETGVRNGKDQPASWLENPSYALKGCSKISNIDQRHDTDTAGKLTVAKLLSTLCVSLHIHNAQWLLLFIASCERQQVRQDYFRVDRSLSQKLIIPLRDIIVRSLRHSSLPARWRIYPPPGSI